MLYALVIAFVLYALSIGSNVDFMPPFRKHLLAECMEKGTAHVLNKHRRLLQCPQVEVHAHQYM